MLTYNIGGPFQTKHFHCLSSSLHKGVSVSYGPWATNMPVGGVMKNWDFGFTYLCLTTVKTLSFHGDSHELYCHFSTMPVMSHVYFTCFKSSARSGPFSLGDWLAQENSNIKVFRKVSRFKRAHKFNSMMLLQRTPK